MMRSLFSALLRHRLLALLVLLAVSGAALQGALKLRFDFSVEQYFPSWDEEKARYDRFKEMFPHEDAEAVLLLEGDIFTPESLHLIDALTRELEARQDVVEEVTSLTNVQDVRGEEGVIDTSRLLFTELDLPPREMALKRAEILADPLFSGRLISPDGGLAVVLIALRHDLNDEPGRARFARVVEETVEPYRGRHLDLTLSGLPIVRAEVMALLQRDNLLFVLVFALVMLLTLWVFRSLTDLAVVAADVLLSVLWTLGFMGWLGIPFTPLAVVIPIIIMVVGVADTVHILTCYRELRPRMADNREAVLHTFQEMSLSCLLTTFTTAVGFSSLWLMNIQVIGQFGLMTAFGVMASYAASMTIGPILLSLRRGMPTGRAARDGGVFEMCRMLGPFVTRRQSVLVGLGLLGAGLSVVLALQLEERAHLLSDAKPGTGLYERNHYIDQRFGGVLPYRIVFEVEGEEILFQPRVMARIAALSRKLEALPEVGKANSIVPFIEKAHWVLHDEDPNKRLLPDSMGLTAEVVYLLDAELYRHVLTRDFRVAQIEARIEDCGSPRTRAIIADMQREIDAHPIPGVTIYQTGTTVFVQRVFQLIVWNMVKSFLYVFAVVFVTLLLLLRRFRLTLLAMIPNIIPVVAAFAALYVMQDSLRPPTVLVASIVLGLAIDDTIHVLARLRLEWRRSQPDYQQAVYRTLEKAGPGVILTTLILAMGFGVLGAASFQSVTLIGVLVGVGLVVALALDLLMLPALLLMLRPPLGQPPAPRESRP